MHEPVCGRETITVGEKCLPFSLQDAIFSSRKSIACDAIQR